MKKNKLTALCLIISMFVLSGCAPEVGSKKWCENLKEKDKGEWTANEAKDFLKHCVIPDKNQKES